MIRRLLALTLLVLLLPGLAQAVTRFVSTTGSDSNTCAQSENINTPKRNFRGASGAVACMAGGDVLHVRSGLYNEHLFFSPTQGDIPSGLSSWETATTIAKYPPDATRPIIRSPGGWTFEVLHLIDRSWIIIDGLDLDMTNNPPSSGSSAVVAFKTALPTSSNTGGHLRLSNCDVHGGNHSIGGGGTDHQFLNNIVRDGRAYGWYMPCVNCLWEGNEIYNNGGYILHMYETTIPSGLDNNIFRSNRAYNNSKTYIAGGVLMAHGNNNQVYNNLIYDNVHGIEPDYDCTNCLYYNNTVYGNSGTGIKIGEQHPSGTTGTILRNNLVVNNAINFANPNNIAVTADHNMCNTSGLYCATVGNPDFVNAGAGDFHLNAGSVARNQGVSVSVSTTAGASLTPLNTSFYKVARPQGPANDIGAAEYPEGGGISISGNPIYVAQTGGTPTTDCTTAENQATPIRTITQGLACMTVPGKTMFIKAGTYSEVIDTGVTPITGGNGPSFSTATTIEGFGSDVVTIQVPVGSFLPLYLRNGTNDKYIVFRKLIFDSAGRAGSNGPTFDTGVHHIRFENCEIKNSVFETVYVFNANNIELAQTSIHNAGAAAVVLDGTIDGFLCQRCSVYDSAGGIQWNTTGSKGNIVIRESLLQNLSGDAIDAGTSTGAILQNSLVTDNTAGGVRVRAGAGGMKVYNNTIANNGGVGLQCDTLASGVEFTNDITWNNTGGNLVNNCGITPTTTTTTDPLFAVGTYQLADGSSAINTGTNIPSLTVDYAGNARQQGQQDRGAYERDQVTPPPVPGPDVTTRPPALFQAEMFF